MCIAYNTLPKFNAITSSGAQPKKKNLSVPKLERKIGCTGLIETQYISFKLGIFLRYFQGQVCLYSTFALPADSKHYAHLRCHSTAWHSIVP